MNINPINSTSNYAKYKFNAQKTYVSNPISFERNLNEDKFEKSEVKSNKTPFFKKIANFFGANKKEMTPEIIQSDKIMGTWAGVCDFEKQMKQVAKYYYQEASLAAKLGRAYNFQGYIDFDKENSIKLHFGDFDEDNVPYSLSFVSIKDGFDAKKRYDFFNGLEYFTVQDDLGDDKHLTMSIQDKKPIYVNIINLSDKSFTLFTRARNIINYQAGTVDDDGQIDTIQSILSIDEKDMSNSKYYELNSDDDFDVYSVDEDKSLWVKKDTVPYERMMWFK